LIKDRIEPTAAKNSPPPGSSSGIRFLGIGANSPLEWIFGVLYIAAAVFGIGLFVINFDCSKDKQCVYVVED